MQENRGTIWRSISRWFRGISGRSGVVKFDGCPCCVDENKIKEYVPDRRIDKIRTGKKSREFARMGGISRISPKRLMDGGADMFAAHPKNHHRAVAGNSASSPFVR